jgi:CRP-like cAMP-binding protein
MGNVTISSFSYHGREIVFNSLRESEIFGNNLIFSSDPTYKGDVIAKVESVVVLINKNLLLEILQNNNEFLQEFLKINSDFSKSLNTQIKILSFDKAEERFLYFMFINNNRYKYRSITDLSHLLFLKRETLSRLLTRLLLNKDINIDKKNKLIIVK